MNIILGIIFIYIIRYNDAISILNGPSHDSLASYHFKENVSGLLVSIGTRQKVKQKAMTFGSSQEFQEAEKGKDGQERSKLEL